ncbi:hypothetical protein [Shimazuella alba]|uniref:Uncharacterized protein n=1 Tax=Shimazuella alba TaxID=2690964 RepID=A0A6I4VUT3_9BACL|nr:hypothetical protein [Shimazuella alba]MXQ54278.1 hypothetical protein [Shimazuella alba]
MDADEALELLTSIARGEATETVVTPSGEKETKEADINQRIKAIDSLMKRFNEVGIERAQSIMNDGQFFLVETDKFDHYGLSRRRNKYYTHLE